MAIHVLHMYVGDKEGHSLLVLALIPVGTRWIAECIKGNAATFWALFIVAVVYR